jgi:FAD/FMN-containing dehydrogenase
VIKELSGAFTILQQQLQGEPHTGTAMRMLYATDASAYRKMPQAVSIPKTLSDLQTLIGFANTHKIGLIPRIAGTSLAGQVVA